MKNFFNDDKIEGSNLFHQYPKRGKKLSKSRNKQIISNKIGCNRDEKVTDEESKYLRRLEFQNILRLAFS